MKVGEYWRTLLKLLDIQEVVKPDEYEVYNGTVIFWFYDGSTVRNVLKRMSAAGIPYSIEWDREEGLMGLAIKRDVLRK